MERKKKSTGDLTFTNRGKQAYSLVRWLRQDWWRL